jgi:hypothetical protein
LPPTAAIEKKNLTGKIFAKNPQTETMVEEESGDL